MSDWLLPGAVSGGVTDSVFTDDAIRIEKYYDEFGKTRDLNYLDIPTRGSITVHINSNRDGNGRRFENWLDYNVQWWALAHPNATSVALFGEVKSVLEAD